MGFYYVVNMFNLRLTAPLVEMPLKYTIREFTFLKKLIFPRGGDIHINLVDYAIYQFQFDNVHIIDHVVIVVIVIIVT